jgi:CheY-like chemotaxis protein
MTDGTGAPPRVTLRILVVDDHPDSAPMLAELLRISGSDVRIARDGEEALEVVAEYRPEVVLLDIGLPKMDGYSVARAIRKEPWGASMVLVALTGWGQEGDRQRSKEAGFDHHLVKPVDPRMLLQLLASLH